MKGNEHLSDHEIQIQTYGFTGSDIPTSTIQLFSITGFDFEILFELKETVRLIQHKCHYSGKWETKLLLQNVRQLLLTNTPGLNQSLGKLSTLLYGWINTFQRCPYCFQPKLM